MRSFCPFCIKEVAQNNVEYICSYCNNTSRNFQIKNAVAKCNNCSQNTIRVRCPHCHKELPYGILGCEHQLISIIGAKGSTKSHFLTVLIERLCNDVAYNMGFSFRPSTGDVIDRYVKDFKNKIYAERVPLDVTKSALGLDSFERQPLTFQFQSRHSFSHKPRLISFYDVAGEDLYHDEGVRSVARHVCFSSGIIFLIDPLQLEGIRNQVSGSLPVVDHNALAVLNKTATIIRSERQIPVRKKIRIPIAICLSKLDTINPLFKENSVFYGMNDFIYGSPHTFNKGIVSKDLNSVNEEVIYYLQKYGAKQIINDADSHYTQYHFFGLSALGCQPDMVRNNIPRFNPYRVEDPFLWIIRDCIHRIRE